MLKKQLLSVVIPCYNETEIIDKTVKRLQDFCLKVADLDVELIFIDDGSSDHTYELLKQHAKGDANIRIIRLARNFGHQIALTVGIDLACGEAVVLIDADLQDPPEIIHKMIIKWREGYDVVYGVRERRFEESIFKRATAYMFYRLLKLLSDIPIPLDAGDFRLINRTIVNILKSMPERDRFIRGMVSWVGFKQVAISYNRDKRDAGTSKYPFKKMVDFAIDGIFSFSTKPLQISIAMGLCCALLSLVGIVYALVLRIFTSVWITGWTALMIAVLFIGGIQFISLGIIGIYIGRIYCEVKHRPLYVIKEVVGFQNE